MLKEINMLIENLSGVQFKELMIYMTSINFKGYMMLDWGWQSFCLLVTFTKHEDNSQHQ
jgi:hypothetical protein